MVLKRQHGENWESGKKTTCNTAGETKQEDPGMGTGKKGCNHGDEERYVDEDIGSEEVGISAHKTGTGREDCTERKEEEYANLGEEETSHDIPGAQRTDCGVTNMTR